MATTGGEPVFVDTNVLVYAAAKGSPLHAPARQTLLSLRHAGRELWISRQVIREYLAVLSRPQVFSKPVPMSALIDDVRRFERAFRVADEDAGVTRALLDIAGQVAVAGRQIHDANIVATMVARGVERVLTNNVADFGRYSAWVTAISL